MLQIQEGTAHVWFAYDLGQQIDLDQAEHHISTRSEREHFRHQRRAPAYLQFQPAPLRIDDRSSVSTIGGFPSDGSVESTLYDFGAVSIAYRIPLGGRSLDDLHALSTALDTDSTLLQDSRSRAQALLEVLRESVRSPSLADIVESYVVFHVRRWSPPQDPELSINEHEAQIARILRSEPDFMRESETRDALQFRIGYGKSDDLVIDWNGAMLFDLQGEDTLTVLGFANVELLEMRFLDDQLDAALDRSHEVLRNSGGRRPRRRLRLREARENMRRIAQMQIDNALLFESVNNAIKMVGDQFLVRVYRLASRRFHLDDWDAIILRKLETLDSIHDKLSGEQSTRRMEFLEWIIIALFLVSIVMSFLLGHS